MLSSSAGGVALQSPLWHGRIHGVYKVSKSARSHPKRTKRVESTNHVQLFVVKESRSCTLTKC